MSILFNLNPYLAIAALVLVCVAATKFRINRAKKLMAIADKNLLLGRHYESDRDLAKAIDLLNWSMQPALRARARYRRAKVLLELGRHSAARAELRKAISARVSWTSYENELRHCVTLAETHSFGAVAGEAHTQTVQPNQQGHLAPCTVAKAPEAASPTGAARTLHQSALWTPGSPSIIIPSLDGGDDWVELDAHKRDSVVENFESQLLQRVIDQPNAVRTMAQMFQVYRANLMPAGRPVGTCMALGPTGSGKTRVYEAACEILFGTSAALVKIDCAEFQHSHEIAKLIGSPPGYLGHRETHPLLSQEVLNRNHNDQHKLTFVLFDEIEKASDSLWNLMLGILDKATLTLGNNSRVDFSRCIVGATSNLGGKEMTQRKPGFLQEGTATNYSANISIEAARRKFSPEFFNRFDHLMTFAPLKKSSMASIIVVELNAIQARINTTGTPFNLRISEAAREFLIDVGYDQRYGARPLKRAIERELVVPVSNLVSTGQLPAGSTLLAHLEPGSDKLSFRRRQ